MTDPACFFAELDDCHAVLNPWKMTVEISKVVQHEKVMSSVKRLSKQIISQIKTESFNDMPFDVAFALPTSIDL